MKTLTKAEFGRLAGRSRGVTDKLLAAGLPHETMGSGRAADVRIDLGEAVKWLTGYVVDGPPGGAEPSLEVARARLATAQTRLAELKLKQMEGDLISVDAFGPVIERAIASARARLLAVPSKLAPVLSPHDPGGAYKLLQGAMLEVLAELQSMLDDQDPPAVAEGP